MTIELDVVADPVVELSASEDVKTTEPNTPEGTAPAGDVETKQAEPTKTFTQAEVDALVQKRLLKAERQAHRRIEQQLREKAEAETRQREPERTEFRDDEAYEAARIEHLVEKRVAEKVAERERQLQQEKTAEAFFEKAEKAQDRYPDFQQVVGNPMLPINEGMAEFIADSEQGPDIAYFLGKNPERAAQIAHMSPIKAAKELTRIEAELLAKPKPRLSTAPAPITPIGGNAVSSKDPSEMTDAEFAKWRRAQIANRT